MTTLRLSRESFRRLLPLEIDVAAAGGRDRYGPARGSRFLMPSPRSLRSGDHAEGRASGRSSRWNWTLKVAWKAGQGWNVIVRTVQDSTGSPSRVAGSQRDLLAAVSAAPSKPKPAAGPGSSVSTTLPEVSTRTRT